MPQLMRVEVSGDMIADLMNQDANFAFEVWTALAVRLEMGAMADNLSDILGSHPNKKHAHLILQQFITTFERIEEIHFKREDIL